MCDGLPSRHHKLSACAEYAACLSSVHNEVLLTAPGVSWADIAGLAATKQVLQEAVVLPSIRPDIFTGLRAPSKGAHLCQCVSTALCLPQAMLQAQDLVTQVCNAVVQRHRHAGARWHGQFCQ